MRSEDSAANQFWYDTEQIKEYAGVLEDVDNVQSALLLSTQGLSSAQIQQTLAAKGLTNEEIAQSMTEAGLLTNKTELNVAEAQAAINKTLETLASEGNTAALTAEQFAAIGLVTAEGEEAAATAVVTSKKLEQALSDEILNQEQVQLIATTLGLSTAQKTQVTSIFPQLISSFKKMALATWEQVKASAAWLATNPVAWIVAAGAALAIGIKYVSESSERYIKSQQKIIDTSQETIEQYDSEISSLEELQQKLNDAKGNKQKLAAIQSELNKAIGYTPGLLDTESNAWDVANQKISDRIARLKKLREEELDKSITAKKNIFNNNKVKNAFGIDHKFNYFANHTIANGIAYSSDLSPDKSYDLRTVFDSIKNNPGIYEDSSNAEIWHRLIRDSGAARITVKEVQSFFDKQTEYAQDLFADYIENTESIFSPEELNSMIQTLVETGYAQDLEGIQTVLMDIVNNKNLSDSINDYYDSLFDETADSDTLYQNIRQQFDNLEDEYPHLKEFFENYFDSIGTDIEKNSSSLKKSFSFEDIFNASDFAETKEELLELAKAGKISSEVLSSNKEYQKLIDKTGLSADNVKKKILDTLSAQEKLSAASNGISSLSSAYEEFNNPDIGFVTADTLESLPDVFKLLNGGKDFDLFSQIAGDPTSGKEKIQQAFNDIISKYLISQHTLSALVNASESQVNSYIANLKQMGVTNADEIVYLTRESLQKNLALMNESENEYISYLESKDGYDDEYINSVASKNSQLITSLGEPYKTDYNNWCELLSKKAEAFNKFATAIQEAQHHPLSPDNIADEEHAREIIAESKDKTPADLPNNFLASGQAYGGIGAVKEVSKYTAAEITNAKKYIEAIESYNASKKQLETDLETISINFGSGLSFSPSDPNSSDNGSSKDSATSLFDFLELRLSRLKSKTQNIINQITDYTTTALKRTLLNNSITSIFDEIDAQVQAYSRYMAKAESIALDETLKEKVRDGSLEVDYTLTEEQSEALTEYQNWYEKALAAQEEINSLKTEELNKVKELAELEATIYQHRINILDYNKEYNNQYISIQEAMGRELYAADYQDVIDNNLDTQDYLVKQIQIYKELAAKLDSASDAYHEVQEKIQELTLSYRNLEKENVELTKTINELPVQKIQSWLDYLDTVGKEYKSLVSYRQQLDVSLSKSHYQEQINNNLQQIKSLEEQSKIVHSLYITAQNARNLTAQREYSKQYHEIQSSIYNLKAANDELKDSMRDDIYWRNFEKAHTVTQKLADNLQSLNSMIDDDSLFDDNGKLTRNGNAKVALYLKQYETAKEEVVNYMKDLNNAFKLNYQGMYTTDEYNEKLTELQKGLLEASGSVKSFADSLTELYIKQGQAEIDALNELIKSRTEALNKKKEYYDYDKTIRTKSKDIQALETQKAALEATEDTLEKRRKLLELEEQLQEKRDDLEDTKYDHEINLIVNGLDDFTEDIQERFDTYSDNLQNSLEMQTDIINNANKMYADSYGKVQQVLDGILRSYGIDTSQALFNTSALLGSATTTQLMESFFKINSPDYTISNPQTAGNVINCDVTFDFKTDKTSVQDFEQMIPDITDKVSSQLAKNLKKIGY